MSLKDLFTRKARSLPNASNALPVTSATGGVFYFSPHMTIGELLANTTVAACAYIISDAIASLSCHVYLDAGGNLAVTSTSYAELDTRVYNHFTPERYLAQLESYRLQWL